MSCLRGVREVVGEEEDVLGGVWPCGRAGAGKSACVAKCWAMGEARESSPVVGGGEAGNRRGRQSHVNLQLSCSFFLQGKGTPNGRLRERAGRWDMLDAAWETSESALGQYYGR